MEQDHWSSSSANWDVFIDFSHPQCDEFALRDHLHRLAHDAGLAGVAGRVTLFAPHMKAPPRLNPDLDVDAVMGQTAIDVLRRAIRNAAGARRHLVLLLGPLIPGSEVIAQLIAGFHQDPMFGTIQPRFAEHTTDRIWPIPGSGDSSETSPRTLRDSLLRIPPDVVTPELPACCLILRWELLIGLESADHGGSTLAGGLLHLLAHARRLGFRNLVRNRVVVSTSLAYADIYPSASQADIDKLCAIDPHAAGSLRELAGLSQSRMEALLDASFPDVDGRLRLLLDCRGMPALHNGTAMCVLGFLHGFTELDSSWNVHVLSSASAADYHNLVRRYPRFHHLTDEIRGTYAAAVVLNQPWGISSVAELHRHALLTAFLMLDTIAWDIYPGRSRTEAAWRFIARHADGLFYISHFTQERFNVRFPVAPDVDEAVTHLSLAQEDHADLPEPGAPAPNQILIFGNEFDHKHVLPTVQLLSDAFPFHRITAIGIEDAPRPNVAAIASGQVSRSTLLRLIAGADVIVFPSFYEGFGLPVVEGLARGRTVLVRRSALWAEIAAFSRFPGKLCEFDDTASLVEGVGRALAGLPLTELPSGIALPEGASPANWKDGAQRISDLLIGRLASLRLDHWWAREQALRILPQ